MGHLRDTWHIGALEPLIRAAQNARPEPTHAAALTAV